MVPPKGPDTVSTDLPLIYLVAAPPQTPDPRAQTASSFPHLCRGSRARKLMLYRFVGDAWSGGCLQRASGARQERDSHRRVFP